MSVKVYLVGDKNAPKTNSWEHMTNSWAAAEQLKAALGPTAAHKVVNVNQKRNVQR